MVIRRTRAAVAKMGCGPLLLGQNILGFYTYGRGQSPSVVFEIRGSFNQPSGYSGIGYGLCHLEQRCRQERLVQPKSSRSKKAPMFRGGGAWGLNAAVDLGHRQLLNECDRGLIVPSLLCFLARSGILNFELA